MRKGPFTISAFGLFSSGVRFGGEGSEHYHARWRRS
jgi:hypothetical protein